MNLTLRVNTQSYEGWKRARVNQSIDQMVSSFSFQLTERFPGSPRKWDLRLGDPCEVWIGNNRVVKGWIDEIPIEYDANSHRVVITGRDSTGDLVDCAYIGTKTEWVGQKASRILDDLCEPFGIEVVIDDSAATQMEKKLGTFKPNQGDSIFESVRRITRNLTVLPVSYGDGKLHITQAGTGNATDSLEHRNTLSAAAFQSNLDRFSNYVVKGQAKSNDLVDLFATSEPKGTASDSLITRYRPTLIIAETKVDSGTFRDRADWEARNRAGASRSWVFRVQGWTQSDGTVWPINSLVRVKNDILGVDGTMLINFLRFVFDEDSGSITEIGVCHPGKYELLSSMYPIEDMNSSMDALFAVGVE